MAVGDGSVAHDTSEEGREVNAVRPRRVGVVLRTVWRGIRASLQRETRKVLVETSTRGTAQEDSSENLGLEQNSGNGRRCEVCGTQFKRESDAMRHHKTFTPTRRNIDVPNVTKLLREKMRFKGTGGQRNTIFKPKARDALT
ncbi:hypothetical protein BGW80DRAFT_1254705 [Lactifluus volemus]|nr:hypothetical protein BGW80DRAFT_1254705 [Lactifluus volemus]